MNIMYVTTSLRAPNGVCAVNVIESLIKSGHNVTVFTQRNENEAKCPSKIIYSKCKNMYIKKENLKKRLHSKIVRNIVDLFYRIWNVLCYPIWPIHSPYFINAFAKEADIFVKKNNVDVVITEYGDIACLYAGKLIKKNNKKIKVIAYFIDALYCGAKPSLMSEKTKNKKALKLENKILRDYDKVIMMEATQKRYFEVKNNINYYNKIIFLDIPMLNIKITENNRFENKQKCDVVFVYMGSMPRNIRNPHYIFEMFKKINNKDWHLYVYGSNDYINMMSTYRNYNIEYIGIVSHEESLKIMSKADILINIGNSIPEMVPSKIFEYMSMGKSIISTYKVLDDSCIKYLHYYKNSLCLNENAEMLDNCNKLVEFVENQAKEKCSLNNLDSLISKDGPLYKNSPKAFVDCLEDIYA